VIYLKVMRIFIYIKNILRIYVYIPLFRSKIICTIIYFYYYYYYDRIHYYYYYDRIHNDKVHDDNIKKSALFIIFFLKNQFYCSRTRKIIDTKGNIWRNFKAFTDDNVHVLLYCSSGYCIYLKNNSQCFDNLLPVLWFM